MEFYTLANILLDVPSLLVFAIVLAITVAYMKAKRPNNLPNGPPTTSFIGNLDLIRELGNVHLTLLELKKKYGPIYSLQLGWYPAVVIACPKLLKDAFVGKAEQFSNRPNHLPLSRLMGFNKGIINSDGDCWKACRRLVMRTLKDLGLGKTRLELTIQEEAKTLMWEMMKQRGEPFTLDLMLAKTSANIICSMLFGKRYPYNNKEFIELVGNLNAVFKVSSQFRPMRFLPYTFLFSFINKRFMSIMKVFKGIRTHIKQEIKERREKFNSDNINTFVDVYLEAEKQHGGGKVYVEQNLLQAMIDLFLAGTETTSTTLRWAMLFMLHHPDIQQQCREEILSVIGKDKAPVMSDQANMPYVHATICEIQRITSIASTGVFHATKGPVEFHGYKLPDKTIVISDFFAMSMDPEIWDNPTEFRPERFLSESGQIAKPQAFIPFSVGKRICAGENLARMELFLLFSSILQTFEMTCKDKSSLPTLNDAMFGVTLSPPQFDITAIPI